MILFYSSLLVRCSAMCGVKQSCCKLFISVQHLSQLTQQTVHRLYMMNFNEIPTQHGMHQSLNVQEENGENCGQLHVLNLSTPDWWPVLSGLTAPGAACCRCCCLMQWKQEIWLMTTRRYAGHSSGSRRKVSHTYHMHCIVKQWQCKQTTETLLVSMIKFHTDTDIVDGLNTWVLASLWQCGQTVNIK